MAFEELMIAEGSDWCWWYGPEHQSDNRVEFDQLYRSHLANIYRFLNLHPPEELSRPILRVVTPDVRIDPSGPIRPVIDGEVTSYFEWIGAGIYRVDERSGAMHGKRFLVKEVQFGSDGKNLYLRLDFHDGVESGLGGMGLRVTVQPLNVDEASYMSFGFLSGAATAGEMQLAGHAEIATTPAAEGQPVECAFARIWEARCSLAALGVSQGGGLRFQLSLWQGGLPVDAVPQQGWLEMRTTRPEEMAG
jgi:hypothetical protein